MEDLESILLEGTELRIERLSVVFHMPTSFVRLTSAASRADAILHT